MEEKITLNKVERLTGIRQETITKLKIKILTCKDSKCLLDELTCNFDENSIRGPSPSMFIKQTSNIVFQIVITVDIERYLHREIEKNTPKLYTTKQNRMCSINIALIYLYCIDLIVINTSKLAQLLLQTRRLQGRNYI